MQRVVIIGAGPAGLAAAWELAQSGLSSVILESNPDSVGGLSRTATYRGYRFDIGGHRFLSKNPDIEARWTQILGSDLLEVQRLSRIYYQKRLFDYPLRPFNALSTLGFGQSVAAVLSYLRAQVLPRSPVASYEDWVVNHFGERLYRTFFKSYTEKVWGMSCRDISADWAAQRIMGLTLGQALLGTVRRPGRGLRTLMDRFRYPRLGPGMMWDTLAATLRRQNCDIRMGCRVDRIEAGLVHYRDAAGEEGRVEASHVISTMPLRHMVLSLDPPAPEAVREAASGLTFRDFLTVALMVNRASVFADQWLYIHEPSVQVGRIQNYKNWSAEMVPDPGSTCLGLEYFCFDGDGLWSRTDASLVDLASREVASLGLVSPEEIVDGTVLRATGAYPIYDATYRQRLQVIRAFLADQGPWLQVAGRNGMHRYNNQDHAMMTGMLAARNVLGGHHDGWKVNGDAEYLETVEATVEERLTPQPRLDTELV